MRAIFPTQQPMATGWVTAPARQSNHPRLTEVIPLLRWPLSWAPISPDNVNLRQSRQLHLAIAIGVQVGPNHDRWAKEECHVGTGNSVRLRSATRVL